MNIIFTPGTDFENLIGRAAFNPVASRSLQTAALKAEKKGENVIDIEAVKKGPGNGGGNTGKPSNPSEGTGENTGEPSNPSGGAGSNTGEDGKTDTGVTNPPSSGEDSGTLGD